MGSTTFLNHGMGKNAADVYNNLVETAEYYNGCGLNNGTISTTHGFSMIHFPEGKRLNKFINETIDELDTRECWCIELPKNQAAKWKKRTGRKERKGNVFVFFGCAAE